MQKGERSRFVVIIGLVVALMSAGFALAGDSLRSPRNASFACEPTDDPVEGETVEDGETVEEGETLEDGEQGESEYESEEGDGSEKCEDDTDDTDDTETPAPDEGAGVDGEVALEPTEERVKECTEAAGMTLADAPEEKPVPGEKQGLENAIAHVLWNCLRNDNDGLVNALEHLQANLERKEEREELRAERRAEREAAKVAREAAREAVKAAREAARAERKAAHEAAKAARKAAHAS
jgi:hypothetical protein